MRRVLSIVVGVIMAVSFVACGGSSSGRERTIVSTITAKSIKSASPTHSVKPTRPTDSTDSKYKMDPFSFERPGILSAHPLLSSDLAEYKKAGYVILEDLRCTSGEQFMQNFYKDTCKGKPASVSLAFYYTIDKEGMSEELYEKEKAEYPKIYIENVSYDGSKYTITSRLSTEQKFEKVKEYKYLKHYTGKPKSPSATFSTYDCYVLVNDDSVTWEKIEWGMISSQSGDWIEHSLVYQNFIR